MGLPSGFEPPHPNPSTPQNPKVQIQPPEPKWWVEGGGSASGLEPARARPQPPQPQIPTLKPSNPTVGRGGGVCIGPGPQLVLKGMLKGAHQFDGQSDHPSGAEPPNANVRSRGGGLHRAWSLHALALMAEYAPSDADRYSCRG